MNNKVTRLSLKIAEKIEKDLGIKVEPIIIRTHAGHWGRQAGQFLWFMLVLDRNTSTSDIGSCYPATEIAKAEKLKLLSGGEIIPV